MFVDSLVIRAKVSVKTWMTLNCRQKILE